MDDSVKTVKVTLQKGTDGDYLLSCEVVDGGDGAAAGGRAAADLRRDASLE